MFSLTPFNLSTLRILLLSTALSALVACGGSNNRTPSDDTPESFSISAITDAELDTQITSPAVTISGINTEAAVSITGGEYAISGGTFTRESGTVTNGQSIVVRATSADDFATSTEVELTVGGVTGSFLITTVELDDAPEAFSFDNVTPVLPSTEDVLSSLVTVTGINLPVAVSVTNGEYSIDGGAFTSEAGTIENEQTLQVQLTASDEFAATVESVVSIGTVSAAFSVATSAQDITPDAFSFASVDGSDLDVEVSSESASISGVNGNVPISVVGGEYSIAGSGVFTDTAGTVQDGQSVIVRGVSASSVSETTEVVLTVGDASATFAITTFADTTGPSVAVLFPSTASLTASTTLTLRGTVEDDYSDIASVSLEVSSADGVFGTHVAVVDGSSWTATVNLATETQNTISVSATDTSAASNTGEEVESSVKQVVASDEFNEDTVFPESDVRPVSIRNGRTGGHLEYNSLTNTLILTDTIFGFLNIDLDTGLREEIFISGRTSGFNGFFVNLEDQSYVTTSRAASLGRIDRVSSDGLTREIISAVEDGDEVVMNSPDGIAWDTISGDFYVSDSSVGVYAVNPDTGERRLVSGGMVPADGLNPVVNASSLALDAAARRAFIIDLEDSRLIEVALDTGVRTTIVDTGVFTEATSAELDLNNNQILIVDKSLGALFAVSLLTNEVSIVANNDDTEGVVDIFSSPFSVALGNNNLAYVTDVIPNVTVDGLSAEIDSFYEVDLATGERVIVSRSAWVSSGEE